MRAGDHMTFMNKEMFNKWVKRESAKSIEIERNSSFVYIKVNFVKRIVTVFNIRTGNFGVAKCKDTDTFSYNVGVAIAWARYCKKDIPVVGTYVSYNELKLGDIIVLNDGIYVVVQKSLVNVPSFGEIATSGRVTVIGETGNTVNIDTGCVNIEFIKSFMRYDD